MNSLRVKLVLLATACALAAPASAQAKVPPGFFGVTYDREIAEAPAAVQAQQWRRMAADGVQSVRVVFDWAGAQTESTGPFSFTRTDAMVARASRRNLILLPCVLYAPAWARENPFSGASPPAHPPEYAAYLTALVGRYGPSGSFWAEHPELVKRPIRDWQIWNEPSLRFQWDADNWPQGYGELLRAADAALKAADRGSRTVLAGLPNKPWQDLTSLYRSGAIRGHYDVAAIHAYTHKPVFVLRIAQYVRAVMARNGDAAKPTWITEVALPASIGRTHSKNTLQTNDVGMARFLLDTYTKLAKEGARRDARVGRVYWYTWATDYRGPEIFEYAGLSRYRPPKLGRRLALAYYRIASRRLRGSGR